MFGERGDRSQASAHVDRGNQGSGQKAYQEKGYSDASKTVYYSIGAKRGYGDCQYEKFCPLLKWNQPYAYGLTRTKRRKAKGRLRNGSANSLQVYRRFQASRSLQDAAFPVQSLKNLSRDLYPVYGFRARIRSVI